jgi:hypothetical protein
VLDHLMLIVREPPRNHHTQHATRKSTRTCSITIGDERG